MKIIKSTLIDEFTATAFAMDIGSIYKFYGDKCSLGMSLQNLGTKMTYKDSGDSLPTTLRLGSAYSFYLVSSHKMTAAFDIIKPFDDTIKEHLGFEYIYQDKGPNWMALRTGYKFGYDLESFTVGIGFNIENIEFDYSIGLIDKLDNTQRVSISTKF